MHPSCRLIIDRFQSITRLRIQLKLWQTTNSPCTGISEKVRAQPVQAALSSAGTFTIDAALPLLTAWLVPHAMLIPVVAILSLVFLAVLGVIAAQAGGAAITKGAIRVTFWGALAMGLTAMVGRIFGVIA
jgi:VIT1/CCC1 family predicted Fe2+/Mn2+ transporter